MEHIETPLHPLLPDQVNLFGDTRLERRASSATTFSARLLVSIRFTGIAIGNLRVWCDLDLARLKSEERAQALAILTEAANILAGLSLSELADRLDGSVMLTPPKLEERSCEISTLGTDYRLHLLDGYCGCRIEIVTKE